MAAIMDIFKSSDVVQTMKEKRLNSFYNCVTVAMSNQVACRYDRCRLLKRYNKIFIRYCGRGANHHHHHHHHHHHGLLSTYKISRRYKRHGINRSHKIYLNKNVFKSL